MIEKKNKAIEIPHLRESDTFVNRLMHAALIFGESRYHFHRRVNWSYRYSQSFYTHESALFQLDPQSYIDGVVPTQPVLDDVYAQYLSSQQIFFIIAKVVAHKLFAWFGSFICREDKHCDDFIYRKAYVDDIETVYDPEELSVIRAVYPFPINFCRQWRYLFFLRKKGYRFKLAGNPYGIGEIWRFLCLRDLNSYMRMESRAQIRHARELAAQNIRVVQLSDEFDIGSLDFARTLARYSIAVSNSAHGVGKYFPVHAYRNFYVLTQRQSIYYKAVRACNYIIRRLNDRSLKRTSYLSDESHEEVVVKIIFLSQVFDGAPKINFKNEIMVTTALKLEFQSNRDLKLLYKAHPNHQKLYHPSGFDFLTDLNSVNGGIGTLFISLYSTCHIDPTFKGEKILVKTPGLYPQVVFDSNENILELDEMLIYIQKFKNSLLSKVSNT